MNFSQQTCLFLLNLSESKATYFYPSRLCSPIRKISSGSGAGALEVYRLRPSTYKNNLLLLQSETASAIQLADKLVLYLWDKCCNVAHVYALKLEDNDAYLHTNAQVLAHCMNHGSQEDLCPWWAWASFVRPGGGGETVRQCPSLLQQLVWKKGETVLEHTRLSFPRFNIFFTEGGRSKNPTRLFKAQLETKLKPRHSCALL